MISYPKYNKETGRYEITNKDELIAMSHGWCDEMPRHGYYILTNDIDMSDCDNFVPIGSKREKAFVGVFDGDYHSIKNIKIKHEKKYVALFKYLGNKEVSNANVKNLHIENCNILGSQNVAAIAGVNYGIIESCMVSGRIKGDSNLGSHGVGGISGKNKGTGRIRDCFLDIEIEGSFDVGGVSGIQEEGGVIEACLVLGKIKANDENGMAGGIVGSFNAGNIIRNCVVLLEEIRGIKYIGEIIGQFEDETLSGVYNNLVWKGTKIIGNQNTSVIPKMRRVDVGALERLPRRSVWKFDKELGILVLSKFNYNKENLLNIDSTIITSVPVDRISYGQELKISANVVSCKEIKRVRVCYFSDKDSTLKSVIMKRLRLGKYFCSIRPSGENVIYYYIKVEGEEEVTWPYYKEDPICVKVGDYGIQKTPSQITITAGCDETQVGVNWITDKVIKDTVLWYKEKDSSVWNKVVGESYLLRGNKLNSHKVRLTNLKCDTFYQYKVGDGNNNSKVLEFKTFGKKEVSFLFVADPQAVSKKDYNAFKRCLEHGINRITPDCIIDAGDITQNGYKTAEWKSCFDVLAKYFERYLTISIPGNHENKGDKFFEQYIGRFFMPVVNLGIQFDKTLGEFKCGNAHIVSLNTEIMDKPSLLNKQLKWLEKVFLNSDKKWKILVIHRGLYMVNHSSKRIRRYFSDILEKIGVNLVLNGHDHIYTRVTKDGITYITGGTCGNKFYEYVNEENLKIDVWRDKKGCQTYSIIKVNDNNINIEVYSKENEDDWDNWILIDKIILQ